MATESITFIAGVLNPLAHHIQKLGLQLKCPLCLNMLTKPMLLPCDHIFCNCCVPAQVVQCECPLCNHQYVVQDIRAASHIESIVAIYTSLNSTFNAKASKSQFPYDAGRSLESSPISEKSTRDQSIKVILSRNEEINRQNGQQNGADHVNQFPSKRNATETYLNQQQKSPGLSFSSDNNNDIVKETSEDTKSHTPKNAEKDNSVVVKRLMHHRVMADNVFHKKDVKRQKKLSNGLSQTSLPCHSLNQQRDSNSEIIANFNCNLTRKLRESSFLAQPKAVSDQHILKRSNCAFCNSSTMTEGTGPMLYYAHGKQVVEDVTSLSEVIPVHSKCIDWAPQVYYDRDLIKNLEAELERTAKLRCSGCGLNGAALGCLMKSCRRSYHMPCAIEIQDCRWDCDNFLMLCPIHKSEKFPSEKLKPRKRASREVCSVSAALSSEQSGFWAKSSDGPREWVLCGSALSSEEKSMLVKFADICGATVCKYWKPNVTHVIAATDENGACTRTLKVLRATLTGKWILMIDWIKACTEANSPVNEEPYEISLDNYGCFGGPKAGRLRASANVPKLFDGFRFYLIGEYKAAYKNYLLDLVEEGGGFILHTKEQLMDPTCAMQATHPACLVVYNSHRLTEAKDLAKQIGCQVTRYTWILESIAACKLVPFSR